MFGPAFKAAIAPEAIQARNMKDPYPKDLKDIPATRRRSVYMFHKCVVQQPFMQAFDGPDAQASCGRRENTTVAPQALALLNDKFVWSGDWHWAVNHPRVNSNLEPRSSTPGFSSLQRATWTNRKPISRSSRSPISVRPSSP